MKPNKNNFQHAGLADSMAFLDSDTYSFQNIVDALVEPLMIVNRDRDIIWNNRVLIDQYGDQVGKKCHQFLQPEPPLRCDEETDCLVWQTFTNGQRHTGEFSTVSLSGKKGYYLISSSPILPDQAGHPKAVLLTFRDITPTKLMERDICQLKELNEEIIKIVPIGIQLLDRDFRICFWNPAMEQIMHISSAQVLGKKLFDLFPVILKTEMKGVFEKVIQEGDPFFKQSHRQALPNGSAAYYNLSIFPLKTTEGAVTYILICLEDVTKHVSIENELERKTIEQARGIKEWEQKFYTLVENCYDGIGLTKGSTITYVNPSLASMLGYKPQELIDKSLQIIYPDESWDIIQKRLERARRGQQNPPRFEIKAMTKDGNLIDFEVTTTNVYTDGELTTMSAIRDITEKKRNELVEKKLHEHVLHTDRLAAMGRFAAGVAHEINNPLAVLSGRIQELLIKYQRDDELKRNFASMKRVSDRIGKIVDSLLFFSKQKEEPKYLYEINEVIEDAISMFEMQTVTKGVRLVKRYAPNLPGVVITASQIQQVCVNMLINAIDATERGGMITISTRLDKKGKNIVITFKDTGCGIPKDNLDKIFDPFFTTKDVDKGSGLGLSISAGIIRDHKGTIRVRSKHGSGTIFTIKLPLPTEEERLRYGLNPSHYRE